MSPRADKAGALVISLDFELHWGVRDHCPPGAAYEANLLGARAVVPRTLDLFEEFGVAGTWATVGFLFARDREELRRFHPEVRPRYSDRRLDPYRQQVGEDEVGDPLHFAPGLIERIARTPRQEVATHTYSHYLCCEAGQDIDSFRADLGAALAIAAARGVELRSIVFPRNQHNPAYDAVLREAGIIAYRGNPAAWMWRFSDAEDSAAPGRRFGRLADTYASLTGDGSIGWDEIAVGGGLADVRASFFLRPYVPRLAALEPLRLRRLRRAVRGAARRGRIIHLWWHPHNFGAYPDECLALLRGVLEEFARCRDELGMRSLSMSAVADEVLGWQPAVDTGAAEMPTPFITVPTARRS